MRTVHSLPNHFAAAAAFLLGLMAAPPAAASSLLPAGWVCTGACGTLGPDGVVTAPPGGGTYEYITTQGGVPGIGQLPDVTGPVPSNLGSTNGSLLVTDPFTANGLDQLVFNFNFVTSDGATFADYTWAMLVPTAGPTVMLFDARTTTSGDTVPGFGLPAVAVTLVPPSTPIIPGGVTWSPLDPNDSPCYDVGCGYTGWIEARFTPAPGTYTIQFGVSNWDDELWQSGLAISGTRIGFTPIDDDEIEAAAVPEPGGLALIGTGLLVVAWRLRQRRE